MTRVLDLACDPMPRDATAVGRERAILREQESHDRRVLLDALRVRPTVTPKDNGGQLLADDVVVVWDDEVTSFGELSSYERKQLRQGADGIWRGGYPF